MGRAGGSPLITIGITCHNAADTIERAIGSALRQDWPNIELVVVDDCSGDASWPLIERLSRADGRIRAVRHESNRGFPGALNTILRMARGEFVAFFDDDDESAADRLSAQHERIVSYRKATGADLVFCYSDRNVVRAGTATPDHIAFAIGRSAPEPHGRMVADFILGIDAARGYNWGRFGSCTLITGRDALLALGGFDEGFRRSAELDMAVRAAFRGAHFIAVPRPLVTQHKTLSADKAGNLPLRYALRLREKHEDYLRSRLAYNSSRAYALAQFHGNSGHLARSRAYLAVALLLNPRLLKSYLQSRRRRTASGAAANRRANRR